MTSLFNTARLHNKVVLVTGASGGIGAATAKLFAQAGANVVLTARRADMLARVRQECEEANQKGRSGHGGKYATLTVDMRQRDQLEALVSSLPDWARDVDVLVNNAGLVYGVDKVGDISPDEIDVMLETNVRGLIHLTQLFVKRFKERRSGHIINLGSIAGREAYPGGSIVRGIRGPLELTYAVLCDQVCRARLHLGTDEGARRHAHPGEQHPAGDGRDRVQHYALPRRQVGRRQGVRGSGAAHRGRYRRGDRLDRQPPAAREHCRGSCREATGASLTSRCSCSRSTRPVRTISSARASKDPR